MNDTQLDEILDQWSAPPPPPSLRAGVRAGFAASERPRFRIFRKPLMLAIAVGLGAFLILVTQALPQTPPPPPYIVECEYIGYAADGSQTVEMYSTSYIGPNGGEVLLGRTLADRPFGTAIARTLDAIAPIWRRMNRMEKPQQSASHQTVGVIPRCADKLCLTMEHYFFGRAEGGPNAPCASGGIVGNETILGYRTIAVERPIPNPRSTRRRPSAARITMWMAPELGCFALKTSTEEEGADGVFRLASGRQALKVTLNP
jgi:hypothetical protein